MTWRTLAENPLPEAGTHALNAVIIGRTPSQGARSPLLWNAAFDRLGIDGRMLPVDIDADGLPKLLAALEQDPTVIGGAVTMPHKTAVLPHLAATDAVAASAGAANALVRDGNGFVGTNTDGVAALRSIERTFGPLDGRRVLVLGTGGAGSAVAAAVAPALGPTGELVLANRSARGTETLAARLGDATRATVIRCPEWPIVGWTDAGTFDVVINTTSLGFALPVDAGGATGGATGDATRDEDEARWLASRFVSPITGADGYPLQHREEATLTTAADLRGPLAGSIEQTLAWLGERPDMLVFDVIYQPERTLLLTLAELAGCPTMNGGWMNLEQAVIAFSAAVAAATDRRPDDDEVRAAMRASIED